MGRCRRRRHREGSGHSVAPRRRRHPGEAAPGRGEAAGRQRGGAPGRCGAVPNRAGPNPAVFSPTEPYRVVPSPTGLYRAVPSRRALPPLTCASRSRAANKGSAALPLPGSPPPPFYPSSPPLRLGVFGVFAPFPAGFWSRLEAGGEPGARRTVRAGGVLGGAAGAPAVALGSCLKSRACAGL